MEHVACGTLFVLTLLQLCRAEISQILPGPWFSANAINDEFSPKPISELFTPPTASTGLQTFPVTQQTFTVTESPNTITVKRSDLGFSVTEPIVVLSPVSTPVPPSFSSTTSAQSTSTNLRCCETFSTSEPSSTPIPLFSQDLSSIPFTPPITQTPTFLDISSFTQGKQTPTINIVPPSSTPFPTFATQSPPTPSTAPPSVIVVFRDPPSITPTTVSPLPSLVTSTSTSLGSTTVTPTITNSISTLSSTTPLPICRSSPISTISTTSTPITISPIPSAFINRPLSTRQPSLMIRVVAPKGSITNVKINPTTSTQRPRTTRSKRTSKPKRNTYDGCIQSCRGRKDILCSIPLSSTTIDPKDLKSFPSICHMACHNSYRNPAYEMLVEGRCSRLRTRIMTVGSNTKLKRDELKKTEYSIVNTGQGAIIELSNGSIKK